MQKRLFGLLAVIMLIMVACGGQPQTGSQAASADPTEDSEPTESAMASEEESASASASEDTSNLDDLMFGSDYAPEEGTPGGTVVIADWQAAEQLNPYYSNGFKNTQVFTSTMRGLYTVSADGKWHPDLAVTVPSISNGGVVIDDEAGVAECPESESPLPGEPTPGFTVEIDLKPDLLWSDGEPLTLNDLLYTMEWVLDPEQVGLPGGTLGWDLIDDFVVADDGLSASVHFCRGFAVYTGLLASTILPEHYMSTIPVAEAAESSYPVGPTTVDAPVSGPFMYASVAPDTIELVRNDNFNAGVSESPHPAYLDRVVYRFYADKDAMIAGFLNGEIDVATDMLQGDFAAISEPPEGFEAVIESAWEVEHFDFNQLGDGPGNGHPALTDPAVRLAIAQAIDKTALYEFVYPGVPLPEDEPCSPIPPGLFYRTTEGLTCIEFDADAAAAALDDTGWVDEDGDGVREKDGIPLELLHCHTGAPFRQNAGDFLAAAFRDIGVTLTNTAEATIFDGWNDVDPDQTCNLARGTYDTTEFAWVYGFEAAGAYYQYHESQIPADENDGAGANYTRIDDPRMNEALESLFGATDFADQVDLAVEMQQVHTELQPEVILYYRSQVRGLNSNLQNYFRNPSSSSDMWNIEDWFLTES